MKLSTQSLSSLTAVLLPCLSQAATCTAENQVFPWADTAVQMMWSMRAWGCENNWWGSIKVVPQGNWCYNNYSPCWNGWWYYHNHASQQACWDVLEQIIDQCMWSKYYPDNTVHTTNGGWWSYGSEYTEGWFYSVNSQKRDEQAEAGSPSNVTLLNTGDVITAARTVYLNFDKHGNITGVAHDIRHQEDGTFKDVAA